MRLPLLACLLSLTLPLLASPHEAIITVPFADVWSKNVSDPKTLKAEDRETQVLQGEKVLVKEMKGVWIRIEAIEQPEYTHHNTWEGYPGWIHFSALRTSTTTTKPEPQFADPTKFAASLQGTPYLWGGMTQEGIDCSGLTHLAYRKTHRVIPRDSHEQWMKARPIEPNELKPGDLIFSGKPAHPVKISHVTLYAGDGKILEAPQTGMFVRKVTFEEKYGASLAKVHNGSVVGERAIYFGTYRQ